jgi:hypothetical protein
MPALREIFAEYDIRFDPKKLLARGQRTVTRLRTTLQRMNPVIDRTSGNFARLATVIGGAVMVRAMSRFITETIRIGDELDKTSQQLGLTVQELQAFQHAANLGGVDAAAFANSMGQLQRRARDAATGTAEAVESFQALGIETSELLGDDGELRRGSDLLRLVADGMQRTTNTSTRTAVAMEIMGRSGRRMLPMLTSGSEGLEQMAGELETLGGGMSELAIRQSVELTDNLARLRVSFTSLRSAIAVRVLPAIDRGVQAFTSIAVGIGEVIDKSHILEVGLGVAAAAVVALIVAFAPISPLAVTVAVLVAALVALALVIDDVWVGMEGGESVIEDVINDLGRLVGIANAGTTAIRALTTAIEVWQEAFDAVGDFIFGDPTEVSDEQMERWRQQSAQRRAAARDIIISPQERRRRDRAQRERQAEREEQEAEARETRNVAAANELRRRAIAGAPLGTALPTESRPGRRRRITGLDIGVAERIPMGGARQVVQNVEATTNVTITNNGTDPVEASRLMDQRIRRSEERTVRNLQAALVPEIGGSGSGIL